MPTLTPPTGFAASFGCISKFIREAVYFEARLPTQDRVGVGDVMDLMRKGKSPAKIRAMAEAKCGKPI